MDSQDLIHFVTLPNLHACFLYLFEYITYYTIVLI